MKNQKGIVINVTNYPSMPIADSAWDPNTLGFTDAVLRMMIGLGVVVSSVGALCFPAGWLGFLSGAALAIALYLIARQTGRIIARDGGYRLAMLWLLVSQFILWVGMAVLLVAIKVSPLGFIVGVSILPVAMLATLAWYAVQRRRFSS
ncbi:MAG TPA: hypothetical protein VGL77_07870 [Armatimonadota bacterium]|jgi:hypothetical protein